MPIPRVAIVGRPNAGKSSLMNMIAAAKVSIVDPTPGVTRDRVSAIVELPPPVRGEPLKVAEFVDTGGFGVYTQEGGRFDEVGHDLGTLTESIEAQIAAAVETADLVLFCVDAQQGVTPADREIARLLREGKYARGTARRGPGAPRSRAAAGQPPRATPPVRIVATKTDGPKWEAHAMELAGLGFGEPLACSAKTNYMRRDFLEAVHALLPAYEPDHRERARADLFLAIIGKRNAGKSTLVNTLAGAPRVIVSEIPGTTRDAVDVRFELDGRSVVAIDTAGLRRKRSFQGPIEWYALDRLQRSVDRSDVVLLMVDATEKISQVDQHLAMMAQKAYKPAIIVINKWDLVEGRKDPKGKPVTTASYEGYLRKELGGLTFAPISFISGQSGLNVSRTIDLAFDLQRQARERATTGKLNRLIRRIIETQGPTDTVGTFAKVFYAAQTGVEPPTITLVVNKPELFRPNYVRFLLNRFREELPFSEVPIRLVVRARRQREDDLAGEAGPSRVSAGRKGVRERLRGRRVAAAGTAPVEGEALLSDEHSREVDLSAFSDDPAAYFDDDED
jgi:GTPase